MQISGKKLVWDSAEWSCDSKKKSHWKIDERRSRKKETKALKRVNSRRILNPSRAMRRKGGFGLWRLHTEYTIISYFLLFFQPLKHHWLLKQKEIVRLTQVLHRAMRYYVLWDTLVKNCTVSVNIIKSSRTIRFAGDPFKQWCWNKWNFPFSFLLRASLKWYFHGNKKWKSTGKRVTKEGAEDRTLSDAW